jgi:hypothetical protein
MAMRNISDFLVRKGVPSTPTAIQVRAPSQQQGLIGAENHGEQTFADVGARVGEDNETLRNLLLDTDRRLSALDDLKEAFRNLVEPINSALQALEQEKTDNVALRNSLTELRASHETLRAESLAFERRAVVTRTTTRACAINWHWRSKPHGSSKATRPISPAIWPARVQRSPISRAN